MLRPSEKLSSVGSTFGKLDRCLGEWIALPYITLLLHEIGKFPMTFHFFLKLNLCWLFDKYSRRHQPKQSLLQWWNWWRSCVNWWDPSQSHTVLVSTSCPQLSNITRHIILLSKMSTPYAYGFSHQSTSKTTAKTSTHKRHSAMISSTIFLYGKSWLRVVLTPENAYFTVFLSLWLVNYCI